MARPLIDDELWALVEPLLPAPKPRRFRYPGRLPADDRRAPAGIVFVLKTGIQSEDLPAEMGVCGTTCWRRLRAWQRAGVWERLHQVLLAKLHAADRINWSCAAADSSMLCAALGAPRPIAGKRGRPRWRLRSGSKPMRATPRGPITDCWSRIASLTRLLAQGAMLAADWVERAGSWSAPSLGCTGSGSGRCATSDLPRSTRRSRRWPVRTCANALRTGPQTHFVRSF